MTPDYERARDAAKRLFATCESLAEYSDDGACSNLLADRAKLHLAFAAAAMGFVLAPMMPEQPAPEKKPETGTLAELNVKPGDVVEYLGDGNERDDWGYPTYQRVRRIKDDGSWFGVEAKFIHELKGQFRIVSRASRPAPDDLRAAYDREVLE